MAGGTATKAISSLIPVSVYSRSTLFVVLFQAIAVIVLEAYIASLFLASYSSYEGSAARGVPVYLMIFLFSQIFQVVLCWDALLHENTIQMIGFLIMNACCLAYASFQYVQMSESQLMGTLPSSVLPLLSAVIATLAVCQALFILLSFKLYLEFGWKIYKKIGADPKMKNMYRAYQIFLTVLKLDFFFFLAFSVQFLVLVLNPSDPEFTVTIIAIPALIVVLSLAVYGLRREDRVVMIGFMIGCLLAMAYFIFKLVRVQDKSQGAKYLYTGKYLTFFATLSLFCVLITFINAVVCFLNFGKGLQEHIASNVYNNNNNNATGAGMVGDAIVGNAGDGAAPTTLALDMEMKPRKMNLVE